MKNRMILGMVVLAAILLMATAGFAGEKGKTTDKKATTTSIIKDDASTAKSGCAGHANAKGCPSAATCAKTCTDKHKAECKTSEKCKTVKDCTPEEKAKCATKDTKKCCPGHK